jgi:hypothetical protein
MDWRKKFDLGFYIADFGLTTKYINTKLDLKGN